MDRADMDQPSHIALHTLPENPPCPTYIDLIELRTGSGRNGDDTGAVNHTGTAAGIRKEVCQRVFHAHITDDGMLGPDAIAEAAKMPSQALRMVLVVFIVVPIACAYPFFQRYIVSGLTVGSVKG